MVVVYFSQFTARYRNQTSQAESYYRHAAQLVPSNGWYLFVFTFTPLTFEYKTNEVKMKSSPSAFRSTLQSTGHPGFSKGDHLTTIFYYCRSIAVKFPFLLPPPTYRKLFPRPLRGQNIYIYKIIIFCSHYHL